MPLLSIHSVTGDVTVALWRVTETLEDFQALFPQFPFAEEEVETHHLCGARLLERYAVHALFRAVTNREETIAHLPSGKPVVSKGSVSVTHTKGYAAVIYSPSFEVAIDIEHISDRINRVADRFLREDERLSGTLPRLVAWCAKETAFKYYSSDNLLFSDMRVDSFKLTDGCCQVENLKRGASLPVRFHVTEDFVLAYGYQG